MDKDIDYEAEMKRGNGHEAEMEEDNNHQAETEEDNNHEAEMRQNNINKLLLSTSKCCKFYCITVWLCGKCDCATSHKCNCVASVTVW